MIPVSMPCLDEKDFSAAERTIRSGWISSIGVEIRSFEEEFASYIGVKNCVACSNGTTALQLALSALGVGIGDEVIIPNLTFAAVANSVIAVGAEPVCVDIEKNTWNISVNTIKDQITSKTKAIIVVHSYGMPVDVVAIKNAYPELFIIEDCAEAHGAEVSKRKVGSIGDISTFSFYGNKIITTGEGGAVLANDEKIIERVKILRDHGMDTLNKFHHVMPGFNYRMTNIQGAIGRSQLRKIEAFLDERSELEKNYDECLLNIGFEKQLVDIDYDPVNWLYTRLVPYSVDRDQLIKDLKNNGIETRPIFKPIASFVYMKNKVRYKQILETSEDISARGISLPTFNGLKKQQQYEILTAIKNVIK